MRGRLLLAGKKHIIAAHAAAWYHCEHMTPALRFAVVHERNKLLRRPLLHPPCQGGKQGGVIACMKAQHNVFESFMREASFLGGTGILSSVLPVCCILITITIRV
jgi:hypothetical protein